MILSFFEWAETDVLFRPKLCLFFIALFAVVYMFWELLNKIKKEKFFRIKLFLCLSIAFDIGYSVFLFAIGKANNSWWFFTTSSYYALLSSVRIFLFIGLISAKNTKSKIKIMLFCGFFLAIINVAVSVMMFIMIRGENLAIMKSEITVIALAAYVFASLGIAIVGSIKRFKADGEIYFSVGLITLVSAGVSMVTLSNTMLATWGEDNVRLRSIVLPILSCAISIFIIACAIFMIRKSVFALRNLKNEKE